MGNMQIIMNHSFKSAVNVQKHHIRLFFKNIYQINIYVKTRKTQPQTLENCLTQIFGVHLFQCQWMETRLTSHKHLHNVNHYDEFKPHRKRPFSRHRRQVFSASGADKPKEHIISIHGLIHKSKSTSWMCHDDNKLGYYSGKCPLIFIAW